MGNPVDGQALAQAKPNAFRLVIKKLAVVSIVILVLIWVGSIYNRMREEFLQNRFEQETKSIENRNSSKNDGIPNFVFTDKELEQFSDEDREAMGLNRGKKKK